VSEGFGPAVTPASGVAAASWVQEDFDWRLVNCAGFERYVRIDHAHSQEEAWIDPSPELVGAIAEVVARYTATPDRVHLAVWEGHGWRGTTEYWTELHQPEALLARVSAESRRRAREARARRRQAAARQRLDDQLSVIPTFELPLRRYHLLGGPVSAATGVRSPADGDEPQVPDLWWPDDRAWFVATDTDLPFTVVGGSAALTADLFAALPERSRPWDARRDDGAR
jgi:hypothetical protein